MTVERFLLLLYPRDVFELCVVIDQRHQSCFRTMASFKTHTDIAHDSAQYEDFLYFGIEETFLILKQCDCITKNLLLHFIKKQTKKGLFIPMASNIYLMLYNFKEHFLS